MLILVNTENVYALTQFYFAIPSVIQDLKGIILSVEIHDNDNFRVVSWTHNDSSFVPDNKTVPAEPDYSNLHLDDNDFLLAINDYIQPGTRLYICIDIPYPYEQYDCQWDAVDRDSTGFAEFDFLFQSHKDMK